MVKAGCSNLEMIKIFQRAFLLGHANDKILNQITLPHLQPYSITGSGLNLRMHPFSAAIINEQLKEMTRQVQERREIAQYIMEELRGVAGISFPRIPDGAEPAWYAFPIIYNAEALHHVPRGRFVEAVIAEGATGVDIPGTNCPLTEFPCFRDGSIAFDDTPASRRTHFKGEFQNAERFHSNIIKLPVWYGPQRFEFAHAYVNAITKVLDNIEELRKEIPVQY